VSDELNITRKFKILRGIERKGKVMMDSGDERIDDYWKLVRTDYIKSLVSFRKDWIFILTDKGREFLNEQWEIIRKESTNASR